MVLESVLAALLLNGLANPRSTRLRWVYVPRARTMPSEFIRRT